MKSLFTSLNPLALWRIDFERLYNERGRAVELPKRRSWLAVVVAGTLFLLLVGFVLVVSWQRQDERIFVESRPNFEIISADDLKMQVSPMQAGNCVSTKFCRDANLQDGLRPFDIFKDNPVQNMGKDAYGNFILRFELSKEPLKRKKGIHSFLILSLPPLYFDRATTFVQGIQSNSAVYNEQLGVQIPLNLIDFTTTDRVTIDVLFEVYYTSTTLVKPDTQTYFFVTNPRQYAVFNKIVTLNDNLRKNWLSDLSRLVMAVFLLLVFLIIDSSSETMAMALFLGFECFAATIDYGWLEIPYSDFVWTSALAMSAVFKLYFVLQLSRIVRPRVSLWIGCGLAVSLTYAYTIGSISELVSGSYIDSVRDLLINFVGLGLCLRVAYHLAPKKLHWRTAALLIAAFAFLQQSMGPVEYLFLSGVDLGRFWTEFYYFMSASSPYMLAISAFVNISSLEHRVRTLAGYEANARVVEEEFRLAKEVQKALIFETELPAQFATAFYQKSQMHISGDCYHAHWNEASGRLAIVLNDITGHGIQAALKASSCQAIARIVFSAEGHSKRVEPLGARLLQYEREIVGFFTRNDVLEDGKGSLHEVTSFIALEFDPGMGQVAFYRNNFTFPLIFSQKQGCRSLLIPNRELVIEKLDDGVIFGLLSDGFLSSSRVTRDLVDFLNNDVLQNVRGVTPANMKDLLLGFFARPDSRNVADDDQTLVLCQWRAPQEQTLTLPKTA